MALLKFLDKDKKLPRDLPKLLPINEVKGFPLPPKLEVPSELPPLFEAESFEKLPEIQPEEEVPEELPDFPEFKETPEAVSEKVEKELPSIEPELEFSTEMIHERRTDEPVFVDVDHFKKILEDITNIKNELKSGVMTGDKILDIKNEQDRKYNRFKTSCEDLERKLLFVDKALFETKYV